MLKKLKGQKGKTGATGATGAAGKEGVAGKEGKEGPFPATLPAGKTVTGAWVFHGSGTEEPAEAAISFPFPLASRPTVHLIALGAPAPVGCSGNSVHPGAAPENLCIFVGWSSHFPFEKLGEYDGSEEAGVNNVSGFTGAILFGHGVAAGGFEAAGTYAVTGP